LGKNVKKRPKVLKEFYFPPDLEALWRPFGITKWDFEKAEFAVYDPPPKTCVFGTLFLDTWLFSVQKRKFYFF